MLRLKKIHSKCYFLCSRVGAEEEARVEVSKSSLGIKKHILPQILSCGSSRDNSENRESENQPGL